ncbi:uncharacterized protein CC84DRAFT_1229978 [Paraphaeosphaeria sporulosa]|uniref:Heterokaryon incompatibility domain-containing protein n=1 Tax=Paraphaeosphaeria sporulosa TaxID=1460663 RepID=A0A177C195_9PLEO|nr:uncharacterized protein CC84DRAFT_1229978 [Paraphaeosphaeria sporulosa]OAG01196.1 hypothetical protein CC84DRAFT_1229978 [Paraphaeosphaeria sporulosa]
MIVHRYWSEHPPVPFRMSLDTVDFLSHILTNRRSCHTVTNFHKVNIQEIITLCENFSRYNSFLDCYDPRDQIFVLLAISSDVADRIVPGYSEECTMETFFQKLLEGSMSLLPLAMAAAGNDLTRVECASWTYQERSPKYTELPARTRQQMEVFLQLADLVDPDDYMARHYNVRFPGLDLLDRGRTPSVTKNKRPRNGMIEVLEGDVIVALQGADSLFVLRSAGSKYRLVGDAWVDGLMNSEAYQGLGSDQVDVDIDII